MTRRPVVLVVNGPNLDRLGERQPEIYGTTTLAELEEELVKRGAELGVDVECVQFNAEDDVVAAVAGAGERASAVILNPAALTHYSYPLREAVAACGVPVIEVHISNIYGREPYRRHSLISGVARGAVVGLGIRGYFLALETIAGETEA
jgi:3-dehydroquinate dehydratase II